MIRKVSKRRGMLLRLMLAFLVTAGMVACKEKAKPAETVNVTTDARLRIAMADLIKNYPGILVTVENGVVTLQGRIDRARLTPLLEAVRNLNPKRISDELKVY